MKICAPTWHDQVWNELKHVKLKLLIGAYAQNYYLPDDKRNLTEKVKNYNDYLPEYFVIPHPSPVNRFWRMKNPWFENTVVTKLQEHVNSIL
jgi:uracil-DNA glycosylase